MPTPESPRQPNVVLLAHGPAAVTLTAARQLESVVHDPKNIIVVAATAPGLTAVERAGDRGYTTVPDHGPEALLIGLDRSSHGGSSPLLVLHDDVVIDEKSIAALVDAHADRGEVAIPAGLGHDAHRRLEEVDVVCAVGTRDQMVDLAERSAFSPGMRTDGPFVSIEAPGAVHRAGCQQRFVAERDLDRPLLVAALIVRDESEHLPACLESLEGLVDRIEIADTGSLDDTVAIARRAGANVIEIEWQNDFAWARNQVLERCQDASYIIWIDADERLRCDDPSSFRALLGTYQRLYPAYSMTLHNVNAQEVETHSFVARRIVDPRLVAFEGALHEQPVRHDGSPLLTAFLSSASITHLGYDESVVDLRQKMNRNLDIAQRSFDEDPSESHAVHLARALKGASSDPEATLLQIQPLMASISDSSPTVQALINGVRAELLLSADRLDEAVAVAKETLELVPADAIAGAVLAESLFRSNRVEEVLTNAADYAGRPSPTPLMKDSLAAQTRARVVFESALRVGDLDTAIAQVGEIPETLDPWPPLCGVLPTDDFARLATTAGTTGDERFFRALATCHDLTTVMLTEAISRFGGENAVTDSSALLRSLRDDLHLVDSAPAARQRFEQSGDLDHAVAYASCLVAGFIDLHVELDDINSQPKPLAATLEIAAEANHRRGRLDAAMADAIMCLDSWPAATRAAIIAAQGTADRGEHERAIAIVHSARADHDGPPLPQARRHQLASICSLAHLRCGDLAASVSEAVEIVDSGGTLGHWDQLLQAADGDMQALALVLGLALLGDEEAFIDAVARAVAPSRTAEICGTYLALGGTNPDAVSTGLLAAVLAGQNELALVIAKHGEKLPAEIRSRLADHLTDVGSADLALQVMADHAEHAA